MCTSTTFLSKLVYMRALLFGICVVSSWPWACTAWNYMEFSNLKFAWSWLLLSSPKLTLVSLDKMQPQSCHIVWVCLEPFLKQSCLNSIPYARASSNPGTVPRSMIPFANHPKAHQVHGHLKLQVSFTFPSWIDGYQWSSTRCLQDSRGASGVPPIAPPGEWYQRSSMLLPSTRRTLAKKMSQFESHWNLRPPRASLHSKDCGGLSYGMDSVKTLETSQKVPSLKSVK